MVSWTGVLAGYESFQDRELKREQLALERDQFNQTLRIRALEALGTNGLVGRRSSTSSTATEIANEYNRAAGLFPDSDIAQRLAATGNLEAFRSFNDRVEQGLAAATEQGRQAEYLMGVQTAIGNFEINPAEEVERDFTTFETMFGSIDDLEADLGIEIPRTEMVPGGIVGQAPMYQPYSTREDYTNIEERVDQAALQQAERERVNVNRYLSQINSELESPDLAERRRNQLIADRDSLTERVLRVDEAIGKAEDGDPFALLNLFGNSAMESIRNAAGPIIEDSALLPAYQENIDGIPITVVSEDQLVRFYEAGILREGDQYMYNGRIYTASRRGE
jgi:hypothetical protein